MRKSSLMLMLFFAFSIFSYANESKIDIQPAVQSMKMGNETIKLPQSISIVSNKDINPNVLNKLKTIFGGEESKKGFKIVIGKKGDSAVKKYAKNIPNHKEGYYLSINSKEIVIAGNDDRATYYGLATLSQLAKDGKLPVVEITDYPDVEFRGVVEGFYGTPWSHEARLSQIEFYGANKLNTYIYGPKDDPYHRSPGWRNPYPAQEAQNLVELVKAADKNMVDFVWAIHPGQDIKWNAEDRDILIHKFELMYDLGVRAFAVFFDDISGEGTRAEKQAELLNYIDNNFIQKKGDIKPLILCPTEYNKSWSNIEKGYLPTLGKELNPSINIMWTGDMVCIDISEEALDWVNPHLQRNAYIWWNFPVTDYVRDHLLLGPVEGNSLNIANKMSGFTSNPMEHAEASKIALYSVADYTWNMANYDSQKSWKNAIKYLMPNDYEALQIFANHNSDHGANGHQYRKDESVEMAPYIDQALADLRENKFSSQKSYYNTINSEFSKIAMAADILITSEENPALLSEIKPWVEQFKKVGEAGIISLEMEQARQAGNDELFTQKYKHLQAIRKMQYNITQSYNQNQYQPGISTASLRIAPFIDSVFTHSVKKYNNAHGTDLSFHTSYNPHILITNIEQIKNVPLQTKGKRISISPLLEILKWNKDEFIQIELDDVYKVENLNFDFGQDGEFSPVVELSKDGESWTAISYTEKTGKANIKINDDIKSIRLVNKGILKEIKMNRVQLNLK